MSFENLTRYAALDVPLVDHAGRELALAVVKGTFACDGTLVEEQVPVRVADEVWAPDEERESSIRWPSDLVPVKPGADLVVVGAALSRRPVRFVDVLVQVGERRARVRVHGERVYYRGAGGRVVVGDGAPFVAKPIVYERAYGGTTADGSVVERRNPVGRGVAVRDADLIGQPAPGVEDPARPIRSAGEHVPVGLGAIATSWLPRAGYGGTFDAAWERERIPLMPVDFDPRFNLCAHPLLQFDTPLAAGTAVVIDGMSVEGPIQLVVPRLAAEIVGIFDDGSRAVVQPLVDTLVVDTGRRRFEVAGRATFELGRGVRRLRAIRVEPHG